MTQENRSPREELIETLAQAIYGTRSASAVYPWPCDPGVMRDMRTAAIAALNAIKEAGGVVLMPRDANAKRAWGEITEIPGAYVNVLEADPS